MQRYKSVYVSWEKKLNRFFIRTGTVHKTLFFVFDLPETSRFTVCPFQNLRHESHIISCFMNCLDYEKNNFCHNNFKRVKKNSQTYISTVLVFFKIDTATIT